MTDRVDRRPVLAFVRPCNPTASRAVPAGDAWLHEPKLDGCSTVRLYGRRGAEWTARLPGLAKLAGIACRSAIIDSELVLRGDGGVPDFVRLHLRMRRHRHALIVYAFDLLHRDGRDLRTLPLGRACC